MNKSITTILNSFLMEMYKWEDNANKHIDAGTDIPDEILKQTLKEIYDKYYRVENMADDPNAMKTLLKEKDTLRVSFIVKVGQKQNCHI